jgi:hypothetical protein
MVPVLGPGGLDRNVLVIGGVVPQPIALVEGNDAVTRAIIELKRLLSGSKEQMQPRQQVEQLLDLVYRKVCFGRSFREVQKRALPDLPVSESQINAASDEATSSSVLAHPEHRFTVVRRGFFAKRLHVPGGSCAREHFLNLASESWAVDDRMRVCWAVHVFRGFSLRMSLPNDVTLPFCPVLSLRWFGAAWNI